MKKWVIILIIGIVVLILIGGGVFLYFMFFYTRPSGGGGGTGTPIKNPTEGLTLEEALLQFNDDYVDYLVISMGVRKLHNPPFSSNTPKIEVVIDEKVYVCEVIKGSVKIEEKQIENEDIVIWTTRREIVSAIMSLNMRGYIKESISQGRTAIEMKAGYTTLYSKGYLKLYEDMTGESFTGFVVRMFK